MNKKNLALLAALAATTIYGLNHTIAKVVMPHYTEAFGFVQLRLIGACMLFWTISFFMPKEKIEKKDYKMIFIITCVGMFINMLMFIKGLSLSTPINSGLLVTLTPVIVLILSSFLLKEKVTIEKSIGISLGFAGAVLLIFLGGNFVKNAPNIPLGNIMLLINSISYGTYLVLIKPLIKKYHIITLMKWMFLIGVFINLPITFSEFIQVKWTSLPFEAVWRMVFVVFGTTFCTYLLNVYALKTLSPTTIGAFAYLNPLIAIIYAILTNNDKLDLPKTIAAFLVLFGLYLVSKKSKTNIA